MDACLEKEMHGVCQLPDGRTRFSVWAPKASKVRLVLYHNGSICREIRMTPADAEFFVTYLENVEPGLRYTYRLDNDSVPLPDPASRFQPDGVHRPSAVFFPDCFNWTDDDYRGIPLEDMVIYELHVGTFTEYGTFDAIIPRLEDLVDLGVTAIEIMPVAQFPGSRNWGYDGVHPFAVQNSYGGPEGLMRLVDAAHAHNLAILLDVVYNHFGPEGNYLSHFGPYTSGRRTPWGRAVNFDRRQNGPVRRFVIENAVSWIRDFHLDGLRLDAVNTILDDSPIHILAELQNAVERVACETGRTVHVIAETHQNDVRMVDSSGHNLGAIWTDDFHHALYSLLTGEQEHFYIDFGEPQQVAKTFTHVFVNDGCQSQFYNGPRGTPVGDRDRSKFVVFTQNHDRVGDRPRSDRWSEFLPPAADRLSAGLLLIHPCTPLLFMGQEYRESRPFPFFCSFENPSLIRAVRRGVRNKIADLSTQWRNTKIPDPQANETFASSRLDWNWRDEPSRTAHRKLYQDLLQLRRKHPGLRERNATQTALYDVFEEQDDQAYWPILLICRGKDSPFLAWVNFNPVSVGFPKILKNHRGKVSYLLSTEAQDYKGDRAADVFAEVLFPYEMLILETNTDTAEMLISGSDYGKIES